MAKTLTMLNLTILSLLLLLSTHLQTTTSHEDEEDEAEYYILDSAPTPTAPRRGRGTSSRFLITSGIRKLRKGTRCDAGTGPNVCNGVAANNGTSLLYCCKKHCRNVLGDRNNCGVCGHKCRFGERCCGGACTNVLGNEGNCGKCGKKCPRGVKCDYGYCGYA